MTELAIERMYFIETLHQLFLIKKGFGAYAFVSIKDVMILFEEYKASKETADIFIHRYIRSM